MVSQSRPAEGDKGENTLLNSTQHAPCALSRVNRFTKRCVDIVLSVLMAVCFAPLLLTLSAYILIAYRVSPVFCHSRVGQNGKRFICYKFRTMIPGAQECLAGILAADSARRAEWMETRKLKNDPRILPGIGSFLRKSSLDELPQILNVLLGQMSMVGPRPITEDELINYGVYSQYYISVKPGITGLWQIEGRSDTSYEERVALDVWYVEHTSIRLDIQIFWKTVVWFCSGRLAGGV